VLVADRAVRTRNPQTQRLATWPEHYPWIDAEGLHYFRSRVSQARRDVEQGLGITLAHFTEPRAAGAVRSRCCSSSSTSCGR